MHDNQQLDPAATFALTDHRVIALTGRDAAAFAQAQFMNDVDAIGAGQWQWNGWLTPKGRVIALFALLRIDDQTVWLVLPDADPAAMVTALQRYVFRSKVAISVREELKVSAALVAPDQARGARLATLPEDVIEMDLGADGGPRRLRIGCDDDAEAVANAVHLAHWAAFDLRHGLPRLPASQVEQWTPQQLSLDRLNAFSVKKGCYPGQEIVARTHFLGKAKRGLVLLEADAPLAAGAAIRAGDTVLGSVMSTASAAGQHLGLAVLPKERTAVAAEAAGIATGELPLRDGLAR